MWATVFWKFSALGDLWSSLDLICPIFGKTKRNETSGRTPSLHSSYRTPSARSFGKCQNAPRCGSCWSGLHEGLHFVGRSAIEAADRLRALGDQPPLPALLNLIAILPKFSAEGAFSEAACEPRIRTKLKYSSGASPRPGPTPFSLSSFASPLTLSHIARIAAMTPLASADISAALLAEMFRSSMQ